MSNQKIIVMKGLPASGKTTAAKAMVLASGGKLKRVNKDDLRSMLDAGKWSKEREKTICEIRDQLIMTAIRDGFSVVVDDTNLHPKHMDSFYSLARDARSFYGIEVDVEIDDSFLSVPMRECIRRDSVRPNPVGKEVIRRMAKMAGVETPPKYYIEGLPFCVICDLDGTLAIMGDRSPFDASNCDKVDTVNYSVAQILFMLKGIDVFYFSGRDGKYRESTENWLKKNYLDIHKRLEMRPIGNNEKDVVVKQRMFEERIRGKYNVLFVLDDRQQVVDGWRDLGLTCFQVAEGDF